jgi:hypothetical protein
MFSKSLLLALAFLALSVPAIAQDAPPMSRASEKVTLERRCYYAVEQEWNNAIAVSAGIPRFQRVYDHFSKCAALAVKKSAWQEYFADTYGAMFAQIQIAGLMTVPLHKCAHYALAKDLANQALQVEQSANELGNPEFETQFQDLIQSLKQSAMMCSTTVKA